MQSLFSFQKALSFTHYTFASWTTGYPNAQESATVHSQGLSWCFLSLNYEKCCIMFCDNFFLVADTAWNIIFVMVHLVSLRPQYLLEI